VALHVGAVVIYANTCGFIISAKLLVPRNETQLIPGYYSSNYVEDWKPHCAGQTENPDNPDGPSGFLFLRKLSTSEVASVYVRLRALSTIKRPRFPPCVSHWKGLLKPGSAASYAGREVRGTALARR